MRPSDSGVWPLGLLAGPQQEAWPHGDSEPGPSERRGPWPDLPLAGHRPQRPTFTSRTSRYSRVASTPLPFCFEMQSARLCMQSRVSGCSAPTMRLFRTGSSCRSLPDSAIRGCACSEQAVPTGASPIRPFIRHTARLFKGPIDKQHSGSITCTRRSSSLRNSGSAHLLEHGAGKTFFARKGLRKTPTGFPYRARMFVYSGTL